MRTILTTLLVGVFILVDPAGLARADAINSLVTDDERQRVDKAKERLDSLVESLEEAKEIEDMLKDAGLLGDDSELSEHFDKGIESAKYAKQALDKGMATLALIENLIKLRTNIQCISQATSCMAGELGMEREPGCVRGYALGMSTLFRDMHDALKDNGFDYELSFDSFKIATLFAYYVPALKTAAETFEKATMWGQICKSKEICELICSVPENQETFDCAQLLDEDPPLPPACLTLKEIVEGEEERKEVGETLQLEAETVHFVKDRAKARLDSRYEQVQAFLSSAVENIETFGASDGIPPQVRSRSIARLRRAKSRLESAKSDFDAKYALYLEAQLQDELSALLRERRPLEAASCKLQKLASDAYGATLNQPRAYESLLLIADGIGKCDEHDAYVAAIQAKTRVN